MIKFFLPLIFFTSLFSQTINFQEVKYIDALGTQTKKFGTIEFNEEFIKSSYKNSDEVLLFKEETLFIKKGEQTQEIDLNRDMPKKIYFSILEAIYLDDLSNLELYFEIKKENSEITLSPKSVVAKYVKEIKFKKTSKLDFLKIYMLNNDRIEIEQIN